MRILSVCVLCLCLCLCGCTGRQSALAVAEQEMAQVVKLLPPNHTNVKAIGNQWYSFNLEVAGEKRDFMARYWYGSHNEVGITITELKGNQ